MTSIKKCLDNWLDESDRYSDEYNSRFEVGTYNTLGRTFSTFVTTKFLSPYITNTVNLVFKCPQILKEKLKKQYIPLIYNINKGENKISIVHDVGEKREDEWLVARLHHFTTNDHSCIVDLEIGFAKHEYSLQIEGIEFQPLPLEINNVDDDDDDLDEKKKYEEIVKSAEPPLFYTSLHQLKLLLSKGAHLNGGKTWFHLNDSRQHCELISINEAIIPDEGKSYTYYHDYNSRFLVGVLSRHLNCKFKVHARAQFLTPLITYTVNLVFKFLYEKKLKPKQYNINLIYKLEGQTKSFISYLANKREDGWWIVELCHFTSEQGTTTADLQIIFQGNDRCIIVEGIEFLPVQELEKAEQHLEETQPISSDSDLNTYWEQKLRIDYEDMIKMAKDSDSVPMNTTDKELCLILSNRFLLKNGQEWLSLDKNAKKSLMLSPRAAIDFDGYCATWKSIPGSRFGETLHLLICMKFNIISQIKSRVLESETTYATYLVYKLLESDQSKFESPVKVISGKDKADYLYVFLVSPQTPSISASGKVDQKTHNPLNRPGLKGIPQQRSDGWMEVKVWEFQTPTPTKAKIIPISLKFISTGFLDGLIIQAIDFRPIL